MGQDQRYRSLPTATESVTIPARRKAGGFFGVMLLCACLVAAFSAVCVWMQEREAVPGEDLPPLVQDTAPPADPEAGDRDMGIPVVSMDLSAPELGMAYFHNLTPYTPDVAALLNESLTFFRPDSKVLIVHTHVTEGYLENSVSYLPGLPGDVTYTADAGRNVLAVGKALASVFNEKGISVIHCTEMPEEPSLFGAYDRTAEAVRKYLKEDPSIALVIDLHRDAILTADGEYVRTLTPEQQPATAQVLAVVGTDCNGTAHPHWQQNLALGLQLREKLQERVPGLCRPVSLRPASYHQETAPAYLLLEIGSGGNTVEEAVRAAELVGAVLADLLKAQP